MQPQASPDGTAPKAAVVYRARNLWRAWLLLVVGLWLVWGALPTGAQRDADPQLLHVQQMRRPPVLQPTGELLRVYERLRPAALRIEARCVTPLGGRQVLGVGSGFFFTADGAVFTAYHVVDPSGAARDCIAQYVGIDTARNEYPLQLVGFDAYMDLAVMQATLTSRVPFIPLASGLPVAGSPVVAIGNSDGDFIAARAGRVTRLGVRPARADFADETIELTNSLAPGDSGGPVLNAQGEAVGVVSYISTNPDAMRSNVPLPPFLAGLSLTLDYAAYAVPVVADSSLVQGLLSGEQRDVPVIGFTWQPGFDYDPQDTTVDLGPRAGTIVGSVAPGGPAAAAGLQPYTVEPVFDAAGRQVGSAPKADVIVAIDGQPTPNFATLLAVVRSKAIGQVVELTVQRGSGTYRLSLTLGARRSVFVAPR